MPRLLLYAACAARRTASGGRYAAAPNCVWMLLPAAWSTVRFAETYNRKAEAFVPRLLFYTACAARPKLRLDAVACGLLYLSGRKPIAEKPRHLCLGFCSTRPALRARFRPRRCPRHPCRAGEVAPAQQATEGCWRFTHLTKETQTFGTPPAALARVHLPYNVGEAFRPRRTRSAGQSPADLLLYVSYRVL